MSSRQTPPTSLSIQPFLRNELSSTTHPTSVSTCSVLAGSTLSINWTVEPSNASDSVRIELYQMKDSHSVFHTVVAKRATNGCFNYIVPLSTFDHETNLYFILRSRKKKASKVMVASELFDVSMSSEDDSTTVGSTAKSQRRRNTWSNSCVVDPIESCGEGWDLISSNTKTSATIIHKTSEPLSTFRCKNPILSATAEATTGVTATTDQLTNRTERLVTGSFYFQRRLAYFEVEILDIQSQSSTLTIGWANQKHPMSNVEVGRTSSSVGYRNDGKMITTENNKWLLEHQEHKYYGGDVVGCGLDIQTGCIFYTLNGNLLSLPFSLELDSNSDSIWPVVSAFGQVKLTMKMQSQLKFTGFYQVLESLKKRPDSIRCSERRSLRTRSDQQQLQQERSQDNTRNKDKEQENPEEDGIIEPQLMKNPPPPPPPPPSMAASVLKASLFRRESTTSSICKTNNDINQMDDSTCSTTIKEEETSSIETDRSNRSTPTETPTVATATITPPSTITSNTVSSWSVADVSDWLVSFTGSLARYVDAFCEVGVDGSMLVEMNDADLKEDLNVKIRLHRVKILNEIKRLLLEEHLSRGASSGTISMATANRSIDSIHTWSSPSLSQRSSSLQMGNSSSTVPNIYREHSNSSFVSNISSSGSGYDNSYEDQSNRKTSKSRHNGTDIFALFSNPLVDGARNEIPKLQHDKEMQIMCTSLRKAGRSISLTMSHATTDALCTAVTLGCQVLHYSGHADTTSLSFEDNNGRLHRLDVERLGDLFGRRVGSSTATVLSTSSKQDMTETSTAPPTATTPTATTPTTTTTGFPPLPVLVFVSACHSEAAGNAFLRAGAGLVVAVEIDSKLEDLAAHAFTRAFYLALATGNSVESSFHIGQAAVQAAPGRSKEAATTEAKKFKLMGSGSKDIKPFQFTPTNGFLEPPTLIRDVIPVVPEGFVGRGVEMYSIIRQLKLHRTVSVVGEQGIGKSAVAIAVANYVSERSMYRDGVYYVRCQHDDDSESLSARLLQQWYDRDLVKSSLNGRSDGGSGGNGGNSGNSGNGRGRGISEYMGKLAMEDGFVGRDMSPMKRQSSKGISAESDLLIHLRNDDCLCILDQASGAVGKFVQTIVERTSGVRFLLTTTQRSLADEHSVALKGLTPGSAVRMFIRRCPRMNLNIREIPHTTDTSVNPKDFFGRLRIALTDADVLSPGSIMRVCRRMREPNGLTLSASLKKETEEQEETKK